MTLFERIVAGEIPAKIIWEDEDVLAFLDISQATQGHTLVIPKKMTPSVLTADPDVVAKVNVVAQAIALELMDALGAEGVNILTNAETVSGQTVPHYHVHVIPRYHVDELKFVPNGAEYDIDDIFNRILDHKAK